MLNSTSLRGATLLDQDRPARCSQRVGSAERPFDADARTPRRCPAPLGHDGNGPGFVLDLIGAEPERTDRLLHLAGDADRLAIVLAGIRQQRLDRGLLGVT